MGDKEKDNLDEKLITDASENPLVYPQKVMLTL